MSGVVSEVIVKLAVQQVIEKQISINSNFFPNYSKTNLPQKSNDIIDLYSNDVLFLSSIEQSKVTYNNISTNKAIEVLFNEKHSKQFEKLWEIKTGDFIKPHTTIKDGKIFIKDDNNNLRVLNANDSKEKFLLKIGKDFNYFYNSETIYIGDQDGEIYSLNANDGSKQLDIQTCFYINSDPITNNGILYLVEGWNNKIKAVNVKDGRHLWSFKAKSDIDNPPVTDGGTVYIGSDDWNIYALNEKNGNKKWSYETNSYIEAPIMVNNGIVYVKSMDGQIYALNANNGQKLWSFQTGTSSHALPLVINNVAFIAGNEDDKICALNVQNGKTIWSFQTQGYVPSTPCYSDGIIYAGGYDNTIYAIDANEGKQLWQFKTGGKIFASPVISKGVVYVGSLDCNFYALDAKSGKELGRFQARGGIRTSPIIDNETIYFETENNNYAPFSGSGGISIHGKNHMIYAVKCKKNEEQFFKEISETFNTNISDKDKPKIEISNDVVIINNTPIAIRK